MEKFSKKQAREKFRGEIEWQEVGISARKSVYVELLNSSSRSLTSKERRKRRTNQNQTDVPPVVKLTPVLRRQCGLCELWFAPENLPGHTMRSSIKQIRKLFVQWRAIEENEIVSDTLSSKFKYTREYDLVHLCHFCVQFFPYESFLDRLKSLGEIGPAENRGTNTGNKARNAEHSTHGMQRLRKEIYRDFVDLKSRVDALEAKTLNRRAPWNPVGSRKHAAAPPHRPATAPCSPRRVQYRPPSARTSEKRKKRPKSEYSKKVHGQRWDEAISAIKKLNRDKYQPRLMSAVNTCLMDQVKEKLQLMKAAEKRIAVSMVVTRVASMKPKRTDRLD